MGREMYYVLLIIMNSKEAITSMEIQNKLKEYDIDLSIKMIYKSIKTLNDFLYPIFNKDAIKAYKKKGYELDKDLFNDGELQLLLDSIIYHKDLNSDDKENLINKLYTLSSINQKDRIIKNESVDQELDFSLFLNLETLIKAIDEGKKVSFDYVSYEYENHHFNEVYENHMVSPYNIVLNDNHYYLIGFDDKRKDKPSSFRIDRMRTVLKRRNKINDARSQFDMEEKIQKSKNMFMGNRKVDLTIQFHNDIVRTIMSEYGDLYFEERANGWYETTIEDIEFNDGLISWILSFKNNIKVIGPYVVREEIKNTLKNIEELYDLC